MVDCLGIAPEGWFIIGGMTVSWAWLKGMKVWDHYHPLKQGWCQGCDELQPSACMRWNSIGLYRCNICRDEPKLLDQAKEIEHQRNRDNMLLTGDYGCFRPGAQF